MAVADLAVGTITRWADELAIDRLDIGIEMHVWKTNTVTYRMQSRLLHALEADFWVVGCSDGYKELYITEVGPSTSKRLLTGNGKATKAEMVEACASWLPADVSRHTRETLADAYAHSLICWNEALGMERRDLLDRNSWHDVSEITRKELDNA